MIHIQQVAGYDSANAGVTVRALRLEIEKAALKDKIRL